MRELIGLTLNEAREKLGSAEYRVIENDTVKDGCVRLVAAVREKNGVLELIADDFKLAPDEPAEN